MLQRGVNSEKNSVFVSRRGEEGGRGGKRGKRGKRGKKGRGRGSRDIPVLNHFVSILTLSGI